MKKPISWILLFTFIFLLSQDFLFWGQSITLRYLGLPGWLFWFVFLQILLVVCIWAFAKYFWKEDSAKE